MRLFSLKTLLRKKPPKNYTNSLIYFTAQGSRTFRLHYIKYHYDIKLFTASFVNDLKEELLNHCETILIKYARIF